MERVLEPLPSSVCFMESNLGRYMCLRVFRSFNHVVSRFGCVGTLKLSFSGIVAMWTEW